MIYARGAFEVHALDGRRNDKVARIKQENSLPMVQAIYFLLSC
jgi:hypothetical protein